MNINPKDITEMEIPVPELEQQRQIADEYMQEFERYKETVKAAEERWKRKKDDVFQRLLDEGEQ